MKPGLSGSIAAARLFLLCLVLLAFGLRLYHLDYQSLWRDEVDAILFARRDLSGLAPLFISPGHNGPLYYTILHLWIRLTGDSEFSVRFLSLVCGVLAVPVIFRLGRRWMGDRGGALGALLCATSPYLVWYSQEGKMYALLFLLSMVSTLVYLLALERNRVYWWAFYLAVTAFSLYVHLLAILVVPFHLLLFLVTWPRYRAAWKSWLATFAFLALPYLPLLRWEVALLVRPFTTGHQFFWLHEILAILLFAFSLNAAPYRNLLPLALFVFLLLGGLVLYRRQPVKPGRGVLRTVLSSHQGSVVLGLYLFVPIVCLFLVSLGMPIFTDRYLITVVPAYLLLLAGGVLAVRERSMGLAVFCLAGVLASNLYVVTLQGQTKIKSDFRSVAEYVEEDGRGDLLVFLIPQVRPVFDYYYGDRFTWVDAPYTNSAMGPRDVAAEMDVATQGHHEVWLVVSEAELWDERGLVKQWFDDHGTLLEKRSYARVDVFLYSLEQGSEGRREVC
jgi:mannosyltransferase